MGNTTNIKLTGSVGVAQAEKLCDTVKKAVAAQEAIEFDCAETHDIDAAILQLMFATSAAATQNKVRVELKNVSETLRKSIEKSGASELLAPGPIEQPC